MDPLLSAIARLFVGGLFVAAGLHKLARPTAFRNALQGHRVLPSALTVPAMALVPAIELVAGLSSALILLPASRIGAIACAALLLAYAGLIGFNLVRGNRHVDCGCLGFGQARRELGPAMVVRNMAIAAFALIGALPETSRALAWLDGFSIAAGLAMLALLYAASDLAITLTLRTKAS
ncbi:MauE/DoxX family redox-associated membrane protein [Flavisphingomonas formosensis]|uniref:MauE/DoxX family redox-associated membrane protein n=1 Tax=Flavisphingomonas formosensis TaxID=861534 RepID=UPI0012F7B233|nr:MauE/DoxX family redox-associated membrane protein [Sphingomonas formosensis]